MPLDEIHVAYLRIQNVLIKEYDMHLYSNIMPIEVEEIKSISNKTTLDLDFGIICP